MEPQVQKLWGWLQIDIPRGAEGNRLRIVMGGVGLTREGARAGVQGLLDAWPHLAEAAAKWRAARTTDDYFFNNALSFVAIFPYEPDQDPLDGVNQWMAWFLRERAWTYNANIYADPIRVVQGVVQPEREPASLTSSDSRASTAHKPRGGWLRRLR
jgi:hypothetical protein